MEVQQGQRTLLLQECCGCWSALLQWAPSSVVKHYASPTRCTGSCWQQWPTWNMQARHLSKACLANDALLPAAAGSCDGLSCWPHVSCQMTGQGLLLHCCVSMPVGGVAEGTSAVGAATVAAADSAESAAAVVAPAAAPVPLATAATRSRAAGKPAIPHDGAWGMSTTFGPTRQVVCNRRTPNSHIRTTAVDMQPRSCRRM